MVRHRGAVLVDTNVIVDAHRIRSWRALVGGYHVATLENCVTETQTGFMRRQLERQSGEWEPRASLRAVQVVENRECAELADRVTAIVLVVGERHSVDHLETGVLSLLHRPGR